MSLVDKAPKRSTRNKLALEAVNTCSCYFCIRYFNSNDIKEWTDNNETAICPGCGIDAILPGYYCEPLLIKMNKKYFGKKVKTKDVEN